MQQENNPKYISTLIRNYLVKKESDEQQKIKIYPPQLLDFNQIEPILDELHRKVKQSS